MSDLHEGLETLAKDFHAVTDTYAGTAVTDPYPMFAELRATTPVMKGDILDRYRVPSQADYARQGREVHTLFRYNDVYNVLKDDENWLSYIMADGFGASVDNMLLTAMDGETHHKYRALMQPPFLMPTVRRMMDALIKPIIDNEYVNVMRPDGKADLVRDFSLPFPIRVVYAFFGFPEDNESVMKFASWALRIVAGPQYDPEVQKITMAASMEAGIQLFYHVVPIIAARRASGVQRDDLLGFMINADLDGKRFTDEEIGHFVRMLLLAAGETTSRSFINMMVQLLERPDVLEKLRNDRSLIGKAITETMRRDPTAGFLARAAAKDIEIGGVLIKEGTSVSLSIGSANRDPEVYERPDELWLERPMRPVLSFGFGPHMCMGMHIARVEMEVALNSLLDLPNLRFDPAFPKPEIRGMNLRGVDAINVIWDI